jgi:hypothetical protein
MAAKFERERHQVMLLMQQLRHVPTEYRDAQAGGHARDESGADVVVLLNGERVGIQATDLDPGNFPGEARATEIKLAREAEMARESTRANNQRRCAPRVAQEPNVVHRVRQVLAAGLLRRSAVRSDRVHVRPAP